MVTKLSARADSHISLEEDTSLMKNISILCATINVFKHACIDGDVPKQEALVGTVELLKTQVKKLSIRLKRQMYTTVCVVGRSGCGKTHFLNGFLREGLDILPDSESEMKNEVLMDRLSITAFNTFGEGVHWTPQISQLGVALQANVKKKYTQFTPHVSNDCDYIDLLPEGDMLSTTKVPVHIFFGERTKISFAYMSAEQADLELKKLISVLTSKSPKGTEFNLKTEASCHRVGDHKTFRWLETNSDACLIRALSILGMSFTTNIHDLSSDDIALPEHISECLGHVFTCKLEDCSLSQELKYVKSVLRSMLCGEHARWGLLNFVAVELPCSHLSRGVEILDLPGFDSEIFRNSTHCIDSVRQATRCVHVCDERRLGGDLSQFLRTHFLQKVIFDTDDYRLVSVYKANQKTHTKEFIEALLKARSEELLNLVPWMRGADVLTSHAEGKISQWCKICIIPINSSPHETHGIFDFIFDPKSKASRRELIKIRHQFHELKKVFIHHIFDISKILRQRVCSEHVTQNFSSLERCHKTMPVLQNDSQEEITWCLESLVGDFNGLFEHLHEKQRAFLFALERDLYHEQARGDSGNMHNLHIHDKTIFLTITRITQTFSQRLDTFAHTILDASSSENSECDDARRAAQCILQKFQKLASQRKNSKLIRYLSQLSLTVLCHIDNTVYQFQQDTIDVMCDLMTRSFTSMSEVLEHNFDYPKVIAVVTSTAMTVVKMLCDDSINGLVKGMRKIFHEFKEYIMKNELEGSVLSLPIFRLDFFVTGTWIFDALCSEVTTSPLQFQYLDIIEQKKSVLEVLIALSAICAARGVDPYICTSLSLNDLNFILWFVHEEPYPHKILRHPRDIYRIVTSMRRLLGGSHSDFCAALDVLSHEEAARKIVVQDNRVEGTRLPRDTVLVYECIMKSIRQIARGNLPSFSIARESMPKLVALAKRLLDKTQSFIAHTDNDLTTPASMYDALNHLINFWGPSYFNFCAAEVYYDIATVPQLSERHVIIYESLRYLEKEVLACETFFREWGSDILVSFFFFSKNARGRMKEYCLHASQRIGEHWLKMHTEHFGASLTREDILFFNEGLYALKRLNFNVEELEALISSTASKWRLNEYIGTKLINSSKFTYDALNSAMIWAFFFRGTGARVDGTSEETVNEMCDLAVKSLECKVQPNSLKLFQEKCYFVTHRIFTHTSWCSVTPNFDVDDFTAERKFLQHYLPYLKNMRDTELVGEFVQTLKCLGYCEADRSIKDAVDYLLYCRDESGAWDAGHTFARTYHATVCALGAIIDS